MSDVSPDPDPVVDDTSQEEDFDAERAKAKIAKANSEASNLRKRMKELEEKAKKLDEIEDANKSEVERATSSLKAAEERAQAAELKAMRLEVAAAKGLTPAQAKRLVGASIEELEADADELVDTFKPADSGEQSSKPQMPGKPQQHLRSGGDPTEEPQETDPAKLAEAISRGF